MAPTQDESAQYEVYLFLHDECLISQFYTLTLDSIHSEFAGDDIKFIGVFPNEISSEEDITSFKEKYSLDFEMIKDEGQVITKRLGATLTPEVFVIDLEADKVIYQGRIDDAYFRVGKRRTVKTSSELYDVLYALKNNKEVTTKNQPSIGCFIQGL